MTHNPIKLLHNVRQNIKKDKKSYVIYTIFRVFVVLVAIRCLLRGEYESFAICLLALVLFLIPSFLEVQLQVSFSPVFEAIIYLFIFAAEILGEVSHYYTEIPGWDSALHTINGFLCASLGFSLVYIMNRHSKHFQLSAKYLAVVAFCFSMTIGVCWEFVEFSADYMLGTDMQKDFVINNFNSVSLDPNNAQTPVHVRDITQTTINTASGEEIIIPDGYLDIGLIDTTKDLLVNLLGASICSLLGYIYIRYGKHDITKMALFVSPVSDTPIEEHVPVADVKIK